MPQPIKWMQNRHYHDHHFLILSFDWDPEGSQDGPSASGNRKSYNSTAHSSSADGPYRVPSLQESEEYKRRIGKTLSHGICPALLLDDDGDVDTSPAAFGTSLTMRPRVNIDRGLSDMIKGNSMKAMTVRSHEFSHRSILALVSTEWYAVVVPSSAPEYLNLDLVAANGTLAVDTSAARAANVFLSGACGNLHNTFRMRVVGASKGMAMRLRRSVRIITDWRDGPKLTAPYRMAEHVHRLDACSLLYAIYAAADTFVPKVNRREARGVVFGLSINVLIQSGFNTRWIQPENNDAHRRVYVHHACTLVNEFK